MPSKIKSAGEFGQKFNALKQTMSFTEFRKMSAKQKGSKATAETAEKKAVRDYLNARGFFYYHNLAGMGVFPGIADYTAIKSGVCFQLEVKKPVGGVQSENQKEFQRCWEAAGGVYICGSAAVIIDALEKIKNITPPMLTLV
jgi:hypothetical protein